MTKAFTAALLGALFVASSGGTQATKEGGTFRLGIVALAFDTVDAAITGSPGTIPIVNATCARLMNTPDKPFPDGSRIVPELATGFPRVSSDGRTYTFTVRRGVRFSTGAAVTAPDVAHTINRMLQPQMKAYSAAFFEDIVGARDVLAGKAKTASGVRVRGNTITIRLTRRLGDFLARTLSICVIPRTLPADPEGARAPIPSAAPYYVAEYVPGREVVLLRNRFYRGQRPHHIDRFVVDLDSDAATVLDWVDRGVLDYAWVPTSAYAARAVEFRRKYGLNRARFFATPASFLRYFVLNSSRPLFRNNVELRQAANFAVDRRALLRERGPLAGVLTDQYLPPGLPAFRDERIYPLQAPDLKTARRLAKRNLRGGKAVLYTIGDPLGVAQAQIVKSSLKKIGLRVQVKQFPASLYFERIARPGAPFDLAWSGWLADLPDPSLLNDLFESRNIPNKNLSRFDSPRYDALLDRASRSTGSRRYKEYGQLDVDLARNAAPAIAYGYDNALTVVSKRTGCVVVNPYLDLAAVCLK